jgi:hypothetical protein
MYDRRVVRGNTFAALVIPVSKTTYSFKLFRYAARSSYARETKIRITLEAATCRANESIFIENNLFRKEEKMMREGLR